MGRARSLNIPGVDTKGVISATDFVGWYNAVPGVNDCGKLVSGAKSAVVIGNGNVALDIARLLAKTESELAQTDIDQVIIGHTNEPEYRKLQNNELMEAFRDRTVKVDIPYITTLAHEIQIYKKDFNTDRIRGKHIAPHTIEMAAMWATLTRLEMPKKAQLSLMQKLKLYNGKTLPGYTSDNIKWLSGISARSNGFVGCIQITDHFPILIYRRDWRTPGRPRYLICIRKYCLQYISITQSEIQWPKINFPC